MYSVSSVKNTEYGAGLNGGGASSGSGSSGSGSSVSGSSGSGGEWVHHLEIIGARFEVLFNCETQWEDRPKSPYADQTVICGNLIAVSIKQSRINEGYVRAHGIDDDVF